MSSVRPPETSLIGEAPSFISMLEQVSRAAALSKPVLVIGERGTGKELISARMHYLSPRWDQPMIKLNCSSLTESLLESELFGHEAGAFTGAVHRHIGVFERAHQGTLFLDELATIPTRMQEKILRVTEYGEFERVGGSEPVHVDVRIVGATNADLPALARRGDFRPDLLDRLAFDVINLPPLRRRAEDILVLADHFAVNISAELGRAYFPGFTRHARAVMLTHHWPGNVRELKNAVERSVYRNTEHDRRVHEIILDPFSGLPPGWEPLQRGNMPGRAAGDAQPSDAPSSAPLPGHDDSLPLKQRVAEFETSAISVAMERCLYNQRAAADELGLSYHQLRSYLRKYDLLKKYGREGTARRDSA